MAEQFDLDAIAADDALLDLLAAGDVSAFGGLGEVEDDPAIHLLAELRLAVEVDEPSFEMVDDADAFLAACAARTQDPFARRVATRALAAGIAAVAALSISGVAAAVTGDPLSPYEKVFEKVVEELSPRSSFPVRSLDGVVGSKAKGIKASKEITAQARSRTSTDENSVRPASDKDVLANRVGQRDRVPPQVPPKPDDKLKPPPLQEERPTEVRPTQTIQTQQPKPPESEPSKPVEPTIQPTQVPTTTTPTPTPTPTATTTTTEVPAGGEETNSPQGSDNGTSGTQTTVPSLPPPSDKPAGDESGNKPADDEAGKPEKPGADQTGTTGQDGTTEQGEGADHGGQGNDRRQDKPAEDPFATALIRGILAMLNGVMVTPRG